MALNPKPFNRADLINKAIHKGKPNLFAAPDINRHLDILKDSADMLWKLSGTVYNNPFTNLSVYNAGAGDRLDANFSWTGFTVIVRGMEFTIEPDAHIATYSATPFPALRIHLVATKTLVDFALDPVMSGVSGGTLPTPLPSSDHEVFSAPRLAITEYPNAPALGPGEEVICKIATIIPSKTATYQEAKLFALCNSFYTKMLTDIVGNKFGDDISLVEMNEYVLNYFLNYLTEPIGVWKGFHGTISGNFDPTGLGINRFVGWAFMNGLNSTPDWRGRTPIMFDDRTVDPGNGIWDSAYNTFGNQVGEKAHALSIGEMPAHSHRVIQGNTEGNFYVNDFGGSSSQQSLKGDNASNSTIPIRTETIGGGTAHENRQPSVVTGFILRIS